MPSMSLEVARYIAVYKNRSIIENLLFRENKQGWHLEFPPKRTTEAMVAHVMLTMATYALTMAYRDWEDEDTFLTESQYRSFDKGVRRWRREKIKNADEYVIIFVDHYYGILHFAELAALTGIRMKHPPEGMESREKIYRRRGLKVYRLTNAEHRVYQITEVLKGTDTDSRS